MPEEHTMDVDLLEATGEGFARILEHLAQITPRSEYLEGQIEFIKTALGNIESAPKTKQVNQVLEDTAKELGVTADEAGVEPFPESQRELGILIIWGLGLGYVEGIQMGAQITVELFQNMPGASGWTSTT